MAPPRTRRWSTGIKKDAADAHRDVTIARDYDAPESELGVAGLESMHVTVVGAGPTGALAALLLARRGYSVDVYEWRRHVQLKASEAKASDAPPAADDSHAAAGLAKVADASRRSINLALSHRGLRALERAGLGADVFELAIPMRGRMIHDRAGQMTLLPYGSAPDEVLYSISRTEVNAWLLAKLGAEPNARVHYGHKCERVAANGSAEFTREADGSKARTPAGRLLGCDGAFSAVRASMARFARVSVAVEYIAHGYKELSLPPAVGGGHAMPPEALHIWPGREVMLIALPNADGSFTCTLFGDFALLESLDTADKVSSFFAATWPDTIDYMPNLAAEYLANPNAALGTVRCEPWHVGGGRVLLLGDAAHAVVPFYGQGMNCALEDCALLASEIDACAGEWEPAVRAYCAARKPATDCLATLAVSNYEEMRDKTVSAAFLLKARLDALLHAAFPRAWHPSLHSAVSFTSLPYHHAAAACERQDRLLRRFAAAAAAAAIAAMSRPLVLRAAVVLAKRAGHK